jgi:hypothetical protein
MKLMALLACVALVTGCFGYNSSAKKWAYVGNTVLMLGGGAAVALDLTSRPPPCTGGGCYRETIDGGLIAGAVLVSAGLFGIIFNATRPEVKTSR